MKEKNRLLILKILTAGAVFSVTYPVVLLLRAGLFGKSGGFGAFAFAFIFSAAGTAASIVIATGGKLAGKISHSKIANVLMFNRSVEEKKLAFESALLYCSSIIPVFATVGLFMQEGLLRACFEAISIFVLYLLAVRCGLNSAYNNMTQGIAKTGLAIFILAYGFCCYYAPLMYLKSYISIFAYIFLLLFMIVKNQEDIDSNIFAGRFVEKSVLPKNMRIFNLKVIMLLFTLILIFLNLKVAVAILSQIAEWLRAALIALLSLFASDAPKGPEIMPNNGTAATGFPFTGGSSSSPEHPLTAYIRGVIITTVALYVAYKLLLALYRGVFKKLLPAIYKWLRSFFTHEEKDMFDTGGDYADEVEIEKPVNVKVARRRARERARKTRSELKNITNPAERIRCMYTSVLELIQIVGVVITGSDTVWNIYTKTALVPEMLSMEEALETLSEKYEKARYGSIAPENAELSEAENSYNEITVLLLKKK